MFLWGDILAYIDDLELRRLIFAATNKSEEFNQFSDWTAFANKTIPENLKHEQRKIIKYNHLLANLIMLYNVDEMTRVFNQLIDEGYDITADMIKAFAPYRTEHINLIALGAMIQSLKKTYYPYNTA